MLLDLQLPDAPGIEVRREVEPIPVRHSGGRQIEIRLI